MDQLPYRVFSPILTKRQEAKKKDDSKRTRAVLNSAKLDREAERNQMEAVRRYAESRGIQPMVNTTLLEQRREGTVSAANKARLKARDREIKEEPDSHYTKNPLRPRMPSQYDALVHSLADNQDRVHG